MEELIAILENKIKLNESFEMQCEKKGDELNKNYYSLIASTYYEILEIIKTL